MPRGKDREVPLNQPSSPTPYQPARQSTLLATGSPLGSDVEDEVRVGMERLELQSSSSSGSGLPRAGPHSKQKNTSRPRGGAKDVWSFFEKGLGRHTCMLCK